MRTLHRAVTSIDSSGTSIPVPFRSWAEHGVTLRRGEVSMIAGPPGVGKSTLSLAIAIHSKVPTLYVCADSHEATMVLRSVAMITDTEQTQVENWMHADPEGVVQVLRENASHITWMFDPSPTLSDLEDEVNCYREVWGDNPALVIIDNAVDITHDTGDEFSSLRNLMREVKWWSRDTGAAFLMLHHTSESYTGNPNPPRAALHGKISQIPSLILTLATPQQDVLTICPVKNRYGPASPSGTDVFWMYCVPSRMLVKDFDQ